MRRNRYFTVASEAPDDASSKAPGYATYGGSSTRRESGIFTGITTSPSSSLRQCPYRYKIRAGRNLPDKEFRYLRTVIVTADIHGGFGSKLRLAANLLP